MLLNELTDEKLAELNRLGIIPGPEESESAFSKRAAYCLSIDDELPKESGALLSHVAPSDPLFHVTKALFDIAPSWAPILYDDTKLYPWHGGSAWIFQLNGDSPLSALLQLRRSLKERENLFGLVDKREIIAHEMSHIGRMAYEEPIFEEFFAYSSSASPFRRWFGPIVQNSLESGLFAIALFLVILFDLYLLATASPLFFTLSLYVKALPLAMLLYGLLRLAYRQRALLSCKKKLLLLTGSEKSASAVAYRLTDREIFLFSKAPPSAIASYAHEAKEKSLRWRVIASAYPLTPSD